MKLCFLRHGEADWPDWNKPDDERPLTERGRKEMKRVARFLERLKLVPDAILTSPLPRASQTAEIVTHPAAHDLLKRDIASLARYFERRGVQVDVDRVLQRIGADVHRFTRQLGDVHVAGRRAPRRWRD